MARAGLGLTAETLVERAKVSKVTLSDFEIKRTTPNVAAVRAALESAGVISSTRTGKARA